MRFPNRPVTSITDSAHLSTSPIPYRYSLRKSTTKIRPEHNRRLIHPVRCSLRPSGRIANEDGRTVYADYLCDMAGGAGFDDITSFEFHLSTSPILYYGLVGESTIFAHALQYP